MTAIDFSKLKPENKASFTGWRRVLGGPGYLVFAGGLFVVSLVIALATDRSLEITNIVTIAIAVPTFIVGIFVIRRNVRNQQAEMRAFADLNGWQYEESQMIERSSLTPTVAEAFTAGKVKLRWSITGTAGGSDFKLFEVNGIWMRGYVDITVMETAGGKAKEPAQDYIKTEPMDGGVRVILRGNALTREDVTAMFEAAGIATKA